MTPIEEQLLQVSAKSSEATLNYPVLIDEQLHGLLFSVEGDYAPTEQQIAAFNALRPQADGLIAQWRAMRSTDVVALNDMMKKESVPAIYLAAPAAQPKTQAGGGGTQ
jgi:hypothetical protein